MQSTALFTLRGKCSPFFPELCKLHWAWLCSILTQVLFFLAVRDVFWDRLGEFGELGESQGKGVHCNDKMEWNFLSLCVSRCCQRGPGLSFTLGMPVEAE